MVAERNGQKLYVPVESAPRSPRLQAADKARPPTEDMMQLDDTRHKVYIYNIDDELSDSEASDDGRLAFLPDIEKHLRANRIPPYILANDAGNLAGMNNQLVLYNLPSSLTIPEEDDSVRRIIEETKARARARQLERQKQKPPQPGSDSNTGGISMSGSAQIPEQMALDDPDAMDIDMS